MLICLEVTIHAKLLLPICGKGNIDILRLSSLWIPENAADFRHLEIELGQSILCLEARNEKRLGAF